MAYPSWYNLKQFTASYTCAVCGLHIFNQQVHDDHVTPKNMCRASPRHSGDESIASFLATRGAIVKSKALHWKGKVWPSGTCACCQEQNVIVAEEKQAKIGKAMMKLFPNFTCRQCIRKLAEEVDKVATEMTAARAGGEFK